MRKFLKALSYYGYFKNHLYFYPRYALEMFLRQTTGQHRVMLAEIFFEGRCNLHCWHCSSAEYIEKKRTSSLTLRQLEDVVRKLRSVGVLSICYVGGEPVINPDLEDIIKMTNKYKVLPSIITNATLLTSEKVDALFAAGLANLGFSMQSATPEKHDTMVGRKRAFDNMILMIDYCLDKRKTISICVVPTNENLADGDFQSMVDFAVQHNIRINVNLPAPVGKWMNNADCALTKESIKLIVEKYFPLDNFIPDFKQTNIRRKVHCPMGENNLYIFPDGEVCPCTFTHISFGNILEESAEAILERMDASTTLKHVARDNICPISMDGEFIAKVHRAINSSERYPPRAEDIDF